MHQTLSEENNFILGRFLSPLHFMQVTFINAFLGGLHSVIFAFLVT